MLVIWHRILHEPSVALGFLTSLLLAIVTVATVGLTQITEAQIAYILAPLVASLGIRQLVRPARLDRVPLDQGNVNDQPPITP